jgi:hypothetical protein
VLDGLNDQVIELMKPMNQEQIENYQHLSGKLQLDDFEFAFDDPEQEQEEIKSLVYNKMTSKNRYHDEFKKNRGIICLTGDRSAIFQCLISVDNLVEKVMTEEQTSAFGKDLHKVLVKVLQN